MAPTPDRWQRIEALYHSALERDQAVRDAFLDGACGQDADLRREGQTVSHYRIVEKLGVGGMGVVVKAEDIRPCKGNHSPGRKIVDHKGASWGSDWIHPNWGLQYSISYVGLARGSVLAGDTAKARKSYQDFLAIWNNADPDIPILQQAKAEYARLQ